MIFSIAHEIFALLGLIDLEGQYEYFLQQQWAAVFVSSPTACSYQTSAYLWSGHGMRG
jgi:hypothetical protein